MTNLPPTITHDWVSPPGETIHDRIEELNWTQEQLAQNLDYSTKHISQLINGKIPLTEEMATRLAQVLGSTIGFWLTREAQYRERILGIEQTKKYTQWIPWLDQFPIKELMNNHIIPKHRITEKSKPTIVSNLLNFLQIASPEAWKARHTGVALQFRQSHIKQKSTSAGAISAWLHLGEQKAHRLNGPPYNPDKYQNALQKMRELTLLTPEQFGPRLDQLFQDSGVAFVLIPSIPSAHVSGVARWLTPKKPLIQLSLYGKHNDKFWFTLFHEAAHILLHAHEKKFIYLDDTTIDNHTSSIEQEANNWAANFLIPKAHQLKMVSLQTKHEVLAFAKEIGIHPGIVVGRLQHDGHLSYASPLNTLKSRFEFKKNVKSESI